MEKESVPARVVIKSLGHTSGNISVARLRAAVHDARGKFVTKTVKALRKADTATGSGHVRFVEPSVDLTARRSRTAA